MVTKENQALQELRVDECSPLCSDRDLLMAVARFARLPPNRLILSSTAELPPVSPRRCKRRMGKSVVLIEPGRHLGGLTAGGLGATDIGNKEAIGGIAREFYRRLGRHYGTAEAWTFEPHVAENGSWGDAQRGPGTGGAWRASRSGAGCPQGGGRIAAIVMESGRPFEGHVFIDATYEGDLMAKAGVAYHVGRESNATYGETLNGVQTRMARYHQFKVPIDPYIVAGDPASGLLPGIHAGGPGKRGVAIGGSKLTTSACA